MASMAPQIHRPTLPLSSFRRPTKAPSNRLFSPIRSSFRRPAKAPSNRLFSPIRSSFSDPFVLQLADTLEDSLPPPSLSTLQKLRHTSSETLLSLPWPSRKDEPFRYTDTSFIKNSTIQPASPPPPALSSETHLVIADGYLVNAFPKSSELPDGVFVGSLAEISPGSHVLKRVSEFLCGDESEKDLFWSINGVGAPDIGVVYVPSGCRVASPIWLRYFAVEGSEKGSEKMPISNPRVVVVVEEGGEVEIVEEFLESVDGVESCYWTNAVLEAVVGKRGTIRHCYVQRQSLSSAHIKSTSVRQESGSTYEMTEISTGGKLSRHNVRIKQLGPDTKTELSTLHLSVGDQTQDLHSSLVLDHPRGYSRQLHKCIVSHSLGQAVFDGNVQVNRYAQQTDAGQLTRSLLLEPRASVNVKPNLQIIADDVKCSHGAAISDLEEGQLFYFRARGIDLETARKALIMSFGAEVFERIPYPSLQKEVESHIKHLLDPKNDKYSLK